tara:strand:+ start:835 stop:1266 length:432 start_codon:yes stop_codon:yes gene_type:complete
MKKSQKIGWQKYEDVLEGQVNNTLAEQLYESVLRSMEKYQEVEDLDVEDYKYASGGDESPQEYTQITLDKDFSKEILLATNYDCWIGHTNFNITPEIKDNLDDIDGVEVLKICTRYRFFLGIGRMFKFSDVRKDIENQLNIKD